MKRLLSIIVVFLLSAALLGVFWYRGELAQQQIIASALPPEPDLSNSSTVFRARYAEIAEQLNAHRRKPAPLADLSRLYHANGFLVEAERCYAGLEQLQPDEPRWIYRRAMILAGYGDVEPARPLFERVVALAPDYLPARLRLADTLLKLNNAAGAQKAYQEVLSRDPRSAYALLGLARLDWEAGRLEPARQRLEGLVKQTNYELGYDLIVQVYERLGMSDRAEAIRGAKRASGAYRDPSDPWMDELMEECYDPYRLALAGGAADRMGNFPEGIKLLERAAQYASNDVSPRFQLGRMYSDHGDIRAAFPHFKQCTEMAPDFADGWAFLSDAFHQLGDEASANRTLVAGLSHCPESPGLHLMQARQLRKIGQRDAALEEYKTSIRLRSNEADAYIELANTYLELDRVPEGIEQLKKSLDAEPENPTALSTLAFHAIATGKETEAKTWLTRIRNQPRISREKLKQLVDAYSKAFHHEP